MKNIIVILLISAFTLTGCASTGNNQATQDAVIAIVAQDVGYGVYRAVPDARPILATICLINDFSKPELVAAQLKELLKQLGVDASKLTTTDAQIAVLTLNNFMALLNVNLANADTARAAVVLKAVITNFCFGVNLATPK